MDDGKGRAEKTSRQGEDKYEEGNPRVEIIMNDRVLIVPTVTLLL